MPAAIPIAIAAAAGAAGVAAGVTTVAAAVISVAATAAAVGASYLMAPSAGRTAAAAASPVASPAAAPANGARNLSVAQATPARRMAFGNCRLGGAVFFQDNNNPKLYIGAAISDGVIESVTGVYFGGDVIPFDSSGDASVGTPYESRFSIEWDQGLTTQAASAMLLDAGFGLDSTFRQQGVARFVVEMDWGADAQQHSALWGNSTNPSVMGYWLRVYDPRDVAQDQDTPSTWKYSANPALCVAHVMRFAWGASVAEGSIDIDWASVEAAANVCDTLITYNDASVKLFELAGVVQADVEIGTQIVEMLSSFGGRINYVAGKYTIHADAARESVWTITDDDILEVGAYQHEAGGTLYNTISAAFFDASDAGNRRETAAYVHPAAGTEGTRQTTIPLPFTPGSHSAQIIAYRELARQRDGRALGLRVTDAGLYLEPGDAVQVTTTYAAVINGTYEVVQVDLAEDGVLLALKHYVSSAYTDPSTYLV